MRVVQCEHIHGVVFLAIRLVGCCRPLICCQQINEANNRLHNLKLNFASSSRLMRLGNGGGVHGIVILLAICELLAGICDVIVPGTSGSLELILPIAAVLNKILMLHSLCHTSNITCLLTFQMGDVSIGCRTVVCVAVPTVVSSKVS